MENKRNFTEAEKRDESFLRVANALYSYWRISDWKNKMDFGCKGHSRIFDVLVENQYITKGESVKGKGHREHVVPCVMIQVQAYKMFTNGYTVEDVSKMIKDNLIIVYITKEEQEKLDNELKLKRTMPNNWNFGDNPYARLELANIKVKYYNEK